MGLRFLCNVMCMCPSLRMCSKVVKPIVANLN